MKSQKAFLSLAAIFLAAWTVLGAFDLRKDLDITNNKFVLTNGLTVIIHEDHKAPIVAINLWYHVGSKNEKPGKTGFAHLFEHMMFTGSQHLSGNGDQRAFFETMEGMGATDLNGTTSNDRTDFFENVPTNAFDTALWMESDRMGHLLEAVDQAKLDKQRGVVQNEKRQDENEPYGMADELTTKATFPTSHPYSWTVIGSMDDLNAASLDDVKNWFREYYGAANVTLVIAGDVKTDEALAKVTKYFASIPSGPPAPHFKQWVAEMPEPRREVAQDHVPQTRLYNVWNVPRYGERDEVALEILSSILTQGKSSRLYKRLVYDDQLATDVSAYVDPREICGQFTIVINVRAGKDAHQAEKAMDEELSRLSARGPTPDEVQRAKTEYFAGFVRGVERIGGFGGVSDILAMNQTYRGDPDYYKTILDTVDSLTESDLRSAGRRWLGPGVFTLRIDPFPDYAVASEDVDRSKLPEPGPAPDSKFPALQRATLPNGLKVILAERHGVPLVTCNLMFDAGFAADEFASPGTSQLAMSMLQEGTTTRTAIQISDDLARLGANLSAGSDLDSSSVSLSALRAKLDESLGLFADVVLHPSFPRTNFLRLQQEALNGIRQEETDPNSIAQRVFPPLLFGHGHAYGNPFTGSGTESSVSRLSTADMQKFHDTWFKPNNATLIVVGDVKLEPFVTAAKRYFGQWASGDVPKKNFGATTEPSAPRLFVVDRPGSIQSTIAAASVLGVIHNPEQIAMQTMNAVLGGAFTSRINMNLREDKHWSYGAFSEIILDSGPSVFFVDAPVQTDKTKEAVIEIDKEIRGVSDKQPITDAEAQLAKNQRAMRLPGLWETQGSVASGIGDIVRFHRPDDYFQTYAKTILNLSTPQLQEAVGQVVRPQQLTWIIIGDRSKIEPGLRELGWGNIEFVNADGEKVN